MKYDTQWMRDHAAKGAILADQVAEYFVAFPPDHREEQIRIWLETMRELIPYNETESEHSWRQ